MPDPKFIYYPAPERSFSDEEMAEVFARHDGRDDILGVIRFLLQARLADATADAADSAASDAGVRHATGRIAELTDFGRDLKARLDLAKKTARKARGE